MDQQRFELSVAIYRSCFYGVALRLLRNREDAEDVAQETLMRLWDIRDKLDDCTSIKSLGIIVARNKCIDRLRKENPTTSLEEVADVDSNTKNAEERMMERDSLREASELIESLPPGQRTVFKLRHVEGLETPKIAEATGQREDAVRTALSRARNRLRELMLGRNF